MLTSAFAGCGGNTNDPASSNPVGDGNSVTTAGNGGDVTTTVAPIVVKDWGGELWEVLGVDHNQFTNVEIDAISLNGNVVNDSVYERNEFIKEKYGIDVKGTIVSNPKTTLEPLLLSGDDLYDAVLYHPTEQVAHAKQGYLLDLTTVPYINLDHPSWDKQANDDLTLNGKLYLANSDFLIQAKARTYFMMYNRELLHTYEGYEDLSFTTLTTRDVPICLTFSTRTLFTTLARSLISAVSIT